MSKNNKRIFKSGQNAAGKSGSFFFFSYDNKFIIKTVSSTERKTLFRILDDFICHVEEMDNQSLIARIYGVFSIKTNIYGSVDIILMQNTSQLSNPKSKNLVFDMKGSKYSRYTSLP